MTWLYRVELENKATGVCRYMGTVTPVPRYEGAMYGNWILGSDNPVEPDARQVRNCLPGYLHKSFDKFEPMWWGYDAPTASRELFGYDNRRRLGTLRFTLYKYESAVAA